jgi:hypothetical protein
VLPSSVITESAFFLSFEEIIADILIKSPFQHNLPLFLSDKAFIELSLDLGLHGFHVLPNEH